MGKGRYCTINTCYFDIFLIGGWVGGHHSRVLYIWDHILRLNGVLGIRISQAHGIMGWLVERGNDRRVWYCMVWYVIGLKGCRI